MRIPDTPEMAALWEKVKPYIKHKGWDMYIPDSAPDEIKADFNRYFELSKEQRRKAEAIEYGI